MKYFVLNPDNKDRLKNLIGEAPTLGAALDRYVSMWPYIIDMGFDRRYLNISGNKRIRKKKLKIILKETFIEEFLDCMDEVELSKDEAAHICSDFRMIK